MELPGLGSIEGPDDYGRIRSKPVAVPLTGRESEIVLEGYIEDNAKDDFHQAIANFLALSKETLRFFEQPVFEYYKDTWAVWEGSDVAMPRIASAAQVWLHVLFGPDVVVSRRHNGDGAVYVSLECECDWEPEHGLQLVLRDGSRVTKVGPFDGHLSNADAFARSELEHVVYVRV